MRNKVDIPFENAIQAGGRVVRHDKEGKLVEAPSGVWMLRQPNESVCRAWLAGLDRQKVEVMMVQGKKARDLAMATLGFSSAHACQLVVWPNSKAPATALTLSFRKARADDLDFITSRYDLLEREELAAYIDNGYLWIALHEQTPVGFVGRHAEGSMGLLEVFEPFRRHGFGAQLETFMIGQMLSEGFTPYADVFADNGNSLSLQRKLGMTFVPCETFWLF